MHALVGISMSGLLAAAAQERGLLLQGGHLPPDGGGLILKRRDGAAVEARPWRKLGELSVSEANHNEQLVYSMVSEWQFRVKF